MPWKRSVFCEERHPHTMQQAEGELGELCSLIFWANTRKLALCAIYIFLKRGGGLTEARRKRGGH